MAKKRKNFNLSNLPQPNGKVLLTALLFSVLVHLLSYVNLDNFSSLRRSQKQPPATERLTVRVVPSQAPQAIEDLVEDESAKRIVEAQQEPTEAPEDARFKGAQDHRTDRETKVRPNPMALKGQDPGQGGRDQKTQSQSEARPPEKKSAEVSSKELSPVPPEKLPSRKLEVLPDPSSQVAKNQQPQRHKPRNVYESLMPSSQDLRRELQAGYQDHIDEELELGDRIDINTTNFRYIGYFTTLRKAFELVWTYPSLAARRGLQGEVQVQFTILKDGSVEKIRVVASSGHQILDDAVVEAIQLSSPYGPLPDGFKKDELTVVGSFRYVLSSFAGAY